VKIIKIFFLWILFQQSLHAELEPINCNATAAIFSGVELYSLDMIGGSMTREYDNFAPNINAAGYNKKDNYIWAYDNDKKDGTIFRIGKDENGNYNKETFTIPNFSGSMYVGDINDKGHLYLRDKDKETVYVINLDPSSANYLTEISSFTLTSSDVTVTELSIADWAFNPVDHKLYTVNKGTRNNPTNNLYQINPNNGKVKLIGDTGLNLTGHFGAIVFDKNGNMFIYHNADGEIYKVDISSGSASYFSSTGTSVENSDGAMCTDVVISNSKQVNTIFFKV